MSTVVEAVGLDHSLRFGAFYCRRARRLVPVLLALVVGVVLVTAVLDPLGDRPLLGRPVLFGLTWTGDLPFGHASPATFHLWTLDVGGAVLPGLAAGRGGRAASGA